MEQNNKQRNDNNRPVQDNKNPITPTNPLKKEENIQDGKERMDNDGGVRAKNDLQNQNFSNPKKEKDDDECCESKERPASGFVAPLKKPDIATDQVNQH